MPRIAPNKIAVNKANEEFLTRHPDRKDQPLTTSPVDARLRDEWLGLFQKYGGKVEQQRSHVSVKHPMTTSKLCSGIAPGSFDVYVYIYKAAADGHGHVGLVLRQ